MAWRPISCNRAMGHIIFSHQRHKEEGDFADGLQRWSCFPWQQQIPPLSEDDQIWMLVVEHREKGGTQLW